MAKLHLQGNKTSVCGPDTSREMSSSLPESSLNWCLSQLSRSSLASEDERNSMAEINICQSRDTEKKIRAYQWRALVAIRTQHIKGDNSGIARFRTHGGLKPLLNLLRHPECPKKTLDLALSILANCCTERETRVEVRKLSGILAIVDILKRNVAMESVQNRAARALGNLAMDPENSTLIHTAGGVPLLLLCVSLASAPSSTVAASTKASCPKMECAQSAARALLYLSDSPSNRLLLLTQGTLTSLAPLIAPEYPMGLRRAALRTLHELTKGCGVECSREVSRSGVLPQLGVMASGEAGKPFEELALKTLANMCSQGCLRPLVGSLEVIQKFTEEVKKEPLKAGLFFKALCLCCKEAVNRAKVKESGGLEVMIRFLSAHRSHPLSRLAILACVDFVYDESALEQLQELGLVPLLVARLVELANGEEPGMERTDVCVAPVLSPSCFDSFDFQSLDGNRKEEGVKEQGLCSSSFLSLRSWLVSEGLISSEGELPDSPCGVEGDCVGPQVPPTSSPQNTSPESRSSSNCHSPPPGTATPDPMIRPGSTPSKNVSLQLHSTSNPQPPSASMPHVPVVVPPSLPSPTPLTPVSHTKFCSPPKKRPRLHSTVRSTVVTLETPPPRPPVYHHPYHPEPWGPESPVLLLLSRFSHATDPSAALVNSGAISGLLFYLTRHRDPSGRCFRMLCRLTCNPNCLQALVRSGSVALIRHHLCQRDAEAGRRERQCGRVKARVKQLGLSLVSNLRVQSESGFGTGVLAHVMFSGSESDRLNCALSLPLINSNKALLKKLLLDNGGLLFALEPMGFDDDDAIGEEGGQTNGGRFPSDWLTSQQHVPTPKLLPLYFSLLMGCLSSLMGGAKPDTLNKRPHAASPIASPSKKETCKDSPPLTKKQCLDNRCLYHDSAFDLFFLLDDGTKMSANREAVARADEKKAEYFRALLGGGFLDGGGSRAQAIPIKDVSEGVLLPVLHYLHGCRLPKNTVELNDKSGLGAGGQCQVLGSLASEGLGISQRGGERRLLFQNTTLAKVMIGARRFLVTELQREVEDLCVSLLLSGCTKPCSRASPAPVENAGTRAVDQDGSEGDSADERLSNRTSDSRNNGCEVDRHATSLKTTAGVRAASDLACGKTTGKSLEHEESGSGPAKASGNISAHLVKSKAAPQDSSLKAGPAGWALSSLLPQVYSFSQRYSYPGVSKACLSLLLGSQGSPQAFSSSRNAADCLRRLVRNADCTDALKRDILSMAAVALS